MLAFLIKIFFLDFFSYFFTVIVSAKQHTGLIRDNQRYLDNMYVKRDNQRYLDNMYVKRDNQRYLDNMYVKRDN